MTLALVLTIPSGQEGYTVYCDASRQSLGGVLMQHENVIAYDLRQLKMHEQNYLRLELTDIGALLATFHVSPVLIDKIREL